MRFLFSDVSNDAHVEADEGADGDYRMPFQVYAEAVLALVKVTEAAEIHAQCCNGTTEASEESFAALCDELDAFDFVGDA